MNTLELRNNGTSGMQGADRDWLDVGYRISSVDVRRQRQLPFDGKREVAVRELIPNRRTNALRVARLRRKQSDKPQVNAGPQELLGLGYEFLHPLTAALVAGRDNFNDRDNTMIARVPDRNGLGYVGVNVRFAFHPKVAPQRGVG